MMSKLGFALFSIGVAVAVTGGAKAPAEGSAWPDTLLVFGLGVGVAVVGLVLWWMAEREGVHPSDDSNSDSKTGNPITELRQLNVKLNEVQSRFNQLSLDDILAVVEQLQVDHVYGVAEHRQVLSIQLGIAQGAELMIAFAYCERMLNRAWSAAADGHHGEALASLQEACETSAQIVKLLPA